MKHRCLTVAISACLLLTLSAHAQSSPGCRNIIIKVNASGGNVGPTGVNAQDTVVGTFQDSSFRVHGFVWKNGSGRLFDFPGADQTVLGGINNLGTAVGGFFDNQQGQSNAFVLHSNGTTSTFSVPGAVSTTARDINDHGVIIGSFDPGAGTPQAFIKTGSTVRTIAFPGADATLVSGINNAGIVVGTYAVGQRQRGFVWINGKFHRFDFPGAFSTFVNGINDHGEIVGQVRRTANSEGEGFTFANGQFRTFRFPGATFTEFNGANVHGDRVGDTVTSDVNGVLSGPGFLRICR